METETVVDESRHSPFHEMTVAELRTWAQRYDVARYAKLRKQELANAVRDAFDAAQGA